MTQTIKIKRHGPTSSPAEKTDAVGKAPALSSLAKGELALNSVDGKLFMRRTPVSGVDTIIEIGANPFPPQAGNSGKSLFTDGTDVHWSLSTTVGSASYEVTQAAHGFGLGTVVYHDGTSYVRSQANDVNTADVFGMVTQVSSVDMFTLTISGLVDFTPVWPVGVPGPWIPGNIYYLSATTAGVLTDVEPITAGTISKPLISAISSLQGLLYNWRGISNEIPLDDINTLLPAQSAVTIGQALLSSGTSATAYWGNAAVRASVPTASSDPGVVGQWAADATHFYWYAGSAWQRIASVAW